MNPFACFAASCWDRRPSDATDLCSVLKGVLKDHPPVVHLHDVTADAPAAYSEKQNDDAVCPSAGVSASVADVRLRAKEPNKEPPIQLSSVRQPCNCSSIRKNHFRQLFDFSGFSDVRVIRKPYVGWLGSVVTFLFCRLCMPTHLCDLPPTEFELRFEVFGFH